MEKALEQRTLVKIEELLQPESDLETKLLKDPNFIQGLLWGKPRFGHPEGKVLFHVREVLDNIDKISLPIQDRKILRLIAFSHDTFKYCEDKASQPRDWSKHHGMFARKYMEPLLDHEIALDIIELHDEAYYVWRQQHLFFQEEEALERLERLYSRIGPAMQLYYLFFKCDTRTGDKNQKPLNWFEQTISGIEIVHF